MAGLGKLTLEHYLERLASDNAAPGGGAAAAVTAAQAAALLSMALRITSKGAAPAATPTSEAAALLAQVDAARARLIALADADGEAFDAVMAAYKLPTMTAPEKAARKDAIQKALVRATEVPLELMQRLDDLFAYAGVVLPSAKPSVVSDAAIAVELTYAAIQSARFNVRINLRYLRDEDYKLQVKTRMQDLMRGKQSLRQGLQRQAKQLIKNP